MLLRSALSAKKYNRPLSSPTSITMGIVGPPKTVEFDNSVLNGPLINPSIKLTGSPKFLALSCNANKTSDFISSNVIFFSAD